MQKLSKYSSNNGRNILIGGLGNDTLRGGFAEGGLQNGSSTLIIFMEDQRTIKALMLMERMNSGSALQREERMYFMILMSIRID